MSNKIETAGFSDYSHSEQQHSYRHDMGVIALPVASRTSAHRLIRLHGGVATRIVKWRMSRDGRPPVIPTAQDTSYDTLIGTTVSPSLPTPSAVGDGYKWDVAGEYVYVQTSPRIAGTDVFPVGQHPFPVFPASRVAAQIVGSSLQAYDGDNPFQAMILDVEHGFKFTATYQWPILAIGPAFSSDHILQD